MRFLESILRTARLRPVKLAPVIPLRPVVDEEPPRKSITVTVKLDMTEAKQQLLELIDLANEAKSIAESIER